MLVTYQTPAWQLSTGWPSQVQYQSSPPSESWGVRIVSTVGTGLSTAATCSKSVQLALQTLTAAMPLSTAASATDQVWFSLFALATPSGAGVSDTQGISFELAYCEDGLHALVPLFTSLNTSGALGPNEASLNCYSSRTGNRNGQHFEHFGEIIVSIQKPGCIVARVDWKGAQHPYDPACLHCLSGALPVSFAEVPPQAFTVSNANDATLFDFFQTFINAIVSPAQRNVAVALRTRRPPPPTTLASPPLTRSPYSSL